MTTSPTLTAAAWAAIAGLAAWLGLTARPAGDYTTGQGPTAVDWGAQRRLHHLFFYFVNVDTVRVVSGPHRGLRITIVTPSRWWGDYRGAQHVNNTVTRRLRDLGVTGWRWAA